MPEVHAGCKQASNGGRWPNFRFQDSPRGFGLRKIGSGGSTGGSIPESENGRSQPNRIRIARLKNPLFILGVVMALVEFPFLG